MSSSVSASEPFFLVHERGLSQKLGTSVEMLHRAVFSGVSSSQEGKKLFGKLHRFLFAGGVDVPFADMMLSAETV